jgi:hypothetical protein
VLPRQLGFGKVDLNAEASQTFKVMVSEPDRVKITKVAADNELFVVKLTEGDSAGSATYEVTFEGTDKIGRMTGKLRVEFTGGETKYVELPVRGQVVGDLTYPQSISFNKRQGNFGERDLTFTSRAAKEVHLLGAEDPDKHLSVEILEAKGKTAKIHVKVAKPDPAATVPLRGHLVIKTTDPIEPEVKIGYGIYFKKGRIDRTNLPIPTARSIKRGGMDVRKLKPPGPPK